jgi:hypothetical protein
MYPFPSINQFRNVVKTVREQACYMGKNERGEAVFNPAPAYPKLSFTGTVKLHGTNAAIAFDERGYTFQSRERVLTREADNAGFMAHMEQWLLPVSVMFQKIADLNNHNNVAISTIVVYGEWCGGNIQKGVAITGLPKMFVIFAIKINDQWVDTANVSCPEASIYNISSYPSYALDIDFEHPEIAQNQLAEITEAVEACCPVGLAHGKEGVGEGIVWRCTSNPSSEYWFKVKGEKHSASKVKTLASVDVEAVEQINDFVAMAVTESRLEQGLHNLINEQMKPFAMTSMGDFIRWVHQDVLKEEADTLQASGIEYKKLGSPIALAAKRWFTNKLNEETFK